MHINACRPSKENMPNRSTAGKGCPVAICRTSGPGYALSKISSADDCPVAGPQSSSLIDQTITWLCAHTTHTFSGRPNRHRIGADIDDVRDSGGVKMTTRAFVRHAPGGRLDSLSSWPAPWGDRL